MTTFLQINVTANWGSTGKIAEQIGLKAINAGWDSFIVYGRYTKSSQNNMIKVGSKYCVYEHYVENRLFDNEGLASRRATRELVELIKEIKPSIIQLHNIHDHWLNYRILFEYLNSTEIPIFWTFHDCWAFTGHCPHFITVGCEKWRTECNHCPLNKSFIDRSRRNFQLKKNLFTANRNLHIVTVSNWLKNIVNQSFLREKDIHVIHNGVDLKVFHPLPNADKEKFQIIGVSNVWTKSKGLYDFYRLRELLSKDEYDITLIGLKPKQVQVLPDGIKGIVQTDSVEELVAYYSSADVMVNPTYADSFPTVNIEALACGTPVITYQTGGSPEIIDEQTGVVVPQGDISAIALAIQNLKQQPISSEVCRKRAEELFDKEECFEKYITLYTQLCQK